MASARNYQNIVNGVLYHNNITLKDLSKKANKQIKDDLLERLLRRAIADDLNQQDAFKLIRSTGFKFSNVEARRYFINTKIAKVGFSKASRKPAALRSNYKFNPDSIPMIKVNNKRKQGKYLYSAIVYLYSDEDNEDSPKSRRKKLPKTAVKTHVYFDYYTEVSEFGFFSSKALTKQQVIQEFIKRFTTDKDRYGKVHGTNYSDIDFEMYDVVGFKYVKTLRT